MSFLVPGKSLRSSIVESPLNHLTCRESKKEMGTTEEFLRHYLPGDVVGLLDLDSLEYTKDTFVDRHLKPKLSDFILDLHQSLAHHGLAKSLDISIGMPTLFANLAASRS
jgi:hypothetical protein